MDGVTAPEATAPVIPAPAGPPGAAAPTPQWQIDTATALVGAATPGQHVSPTVVERLLSAVQATFAEIDRLQIRDQVATVSSGDDADQLAAPTTVLDDIVAQCTAQFTFPNGRARTLAELAQQLQNNVAALSAAQGGGVGPKIGGGPGDPAHLLWAAHYGGTTMTQCGFNEIQVQNQVSNSSIRTNKDDFPVSDSPIGRAVVFAMDNGQVRREGNPNKSNKFDGSGTSYHSLKFYLTHGFPVESDDWQLIWQLHGNDETSPRFSLQLRNHELRIGDSFGGWSPHIETEKPYAVVLKCDRNAGKISVWVDGKWCLNDHWCGTSNTPYYQKNGWYHTVRIRGGKMYQNGHAMGTTLAAVTAFL